MTDNVIDDNDCLNIEDGMPLFDDCKYVEEYNCILNESCGLNVLHLNIRGLYSKLDSLKTLLDDINNVRYSLDVIMICETWMKQEQCSLCNLEGYILYTRPRLHKKGGGIAIYVKEDIESGLLSADSEFQSDGETECLTVKIKTKLGSKSSSLVISEVYRVPNSSEVIFLDRYSELVRKLKEHSKHILLAGDFNIDLMQVNHRSSTMKFFENNLDDFLVPTITLPTRVTHATATLIDNIFVDCQTLGYQHHSYVLKDPISDHYPCVLSLNTRPSRSKIKPIIMTRHLNDKNVTKVKAKLATEDWSNLLNLSCNEGFNNFHKKFKNILDEICPEKLVNVTKKRLKVEWVTAGLVISGKNLKRMHNNIRNKNDIEKYKTYRRILHSTQRRAKTFYYENKISEINGDSRKLWQLMSKLMGKNNDKSCNIEKLEINNIVKLDKQEISKCFGQYFSKVGKDFQSKIPVTNTDHKSYLKQPKQENSVFLDPTNIYEIKRIILELPNKTSCGLDGISNILLKKVVNEILQPLEIIFQKSIEEGIFPTLMKQANCILLLVSMRYNMLFLVQSTRILVIPSVCYSQCGEIY